MTRTCHEQGEIPSTWLPLIFDSAYIAAARSYTVSCQSLSTPSPRDGHLRLSVSQRRISLLIRRLRSASHLRSKRQALLHQATVSTAILENIGWDVNGYSIRRAARAGAGLPRDVPDVERNPFEPPVDDVPFGRRAVESGQHGGVVQANSIPHQSSTMRSRHIRQKSASSRASDDFLYVINNRRSSSYGQRSLPSTDRPHNTSIHIFTPKRIRSSFSINLGRANGLQGPSYLMKPLHQSKAAIQRDTDGHHPVRASTESDRNKPYPPLPQPLSPTRFTMPITLRSLIINSPCWKRRRIKSSPATVKPSWKIGARIRTGATPRAQPLEARSSTPCFTHLDGSIESRSEPATPVARQLTRKVHHRSTHYRCHRTG